MKLIRANMSIPFLNRLVKQLDKTVYENIQRTQNIDSLRVVLDSYNKKTYHEFLTDFVTLKPPVDKTTGYNKYRLHTNEYYDLNMIEWFPGSVTKIHSHPEHGCIVKSLQGMLQETRYDDTICSINKKMIVPVHNYTCNYTHSYFLDSNVIHSIKNLENSKSYSLHLYSPPDYIPKILD